MVCVCVWRDGWLVQGPKEAGGANCIECENGLTQGHGNKSKGMKSGWCQSMMEIENQVTIVIPNDCGFCQYQSALLRGSGIPNV